MRPPSPASPPLRRALVAAATLGLLWLVPGCASFGSLGTSEPPTAAPRLSSVPEWALASTRRDDESAIGIGSGATLGQATRYALRDVAARLSVSVESRLRDVYREVEGTSVESLEHVLETRVLGARFHGWERTRSAERDGVFWAEVRIDRRRLIDASLVELNELADQVDARLAGARGSAISTLLTLQATATDRDRVSNLVAVVDALDPDFDRARWDRRRAGWRATDASARRGLVFEVRSDPASAEIARWLESALASESYAIRRGECGSEGAVCIDIRSEIEEADVANRHVARIRSFFSLVEPGGSVLRELDLTGRGNSQADRDRARRAALDDLRRNLRRSDMLTGLVGP